MKIALVLAVATALVVPASAQAHEGAPSPRAAGQTLRLHDPVGDTWSYSDVSGYVPDPQPAADVLRAQVTHGRNAVGVRMVLDDLRHLGTQWYRVEIQTPTGILWFIVEAGKRHYAGIVYQEVQGEWVGVRGVGHSIDYAADRMTLRVPRRLLGEPAWIRVRMRFELGVPDGTFWTDNPVNTRPHATFSARVPAPAAAHVGR